MFCSGIGHDRDNHEDTQVSDEGAEEQPRAAVPLQPLVGWQAEPLEISGEEESHLQSMENPTGEEEVVELGLGKEGGLGGKCVY